MDAARRLVAWCRPRARRLVTVGLVLLVAASWAPFQLDVPRLRTNQAELTDEGILELRPPSLVRTSGPPAWLEDVIAADAFTLRLDARSAAPQQDGPARIVSVSWDVSRRNITLGQLGSGLALRLRHPGTDQQGQPQLIVPEVFATSSWRTIELDVGDRLRLEVDGELVHDETLAPEPLAGWDPSFPLLFGDERSGTRPWAGAVRDVVLTVDGRTHDLLATDELRRPDRFWDLPERLTEGRSRVSTLAVLTWLLHLVASAAVGGLLALARPGAALGRPGPSIARTAGWWALVVVVVNLGKVVIAGRHPSVGTALLQLCGGLLGMALVHATSWTRGRAEVAVATRAPEA